MARAPNAADLDALKSAAGPHGWSQDPERIAPKLREWRDRWVGASPLLLLPRDVAGVQAVVRCAAERRIPLTLQGGGTGLVGGQIPQGEALLSTERLNAVREVSARDDVLVAEAGVTLAAAHEAARGAGRVFPLSLASEGSATLGGLISTNAGGTAVLRYGTMRELTLGIEAVLPDGTLFSGLKRLRKDNTGYDLKQLLIGAEGTLGVVTAAALKLFAVLASRAVAIAGIATPQAALDLLGRAKAESGGAVEAFELIGRAGVELAVRNIPGVRDPLASPHPWLVLIELTAGGAGEAEAAMERLLSASLADGLIADAALAQNDAQAKAFWRLREAQSAAQKPEGATWKHDVSVPVSAVPAFLERAGAAAQALAPGARVVAFGHVGDGNIHYDVLQPNDGSGGGDGAAHAARRDEGARRIHDIVAELGGAISAEHGLGAMKSAEALRYKDPVQVELMRRVRAVFDPHRILNPRVLF